jgi:hypothetical protein
MHQLAFLFAALLVLGAILLVKKVTGCTVFPFAMAVLDADRLTDEREGHDYVYAQEATHVIYKGAIVCLNAAGYAVEGSALNTLIAAGVADEQSDSTGYAQGVKTVRVKEGVFLFDNLAANLVTVANIGDACYIHDDHTVRQTSNGGVSPIAGYVRDVDSGGVWVEFKNTHSTDGDLVAANNLSDVANAATARANLGANLLALSLTVDTLVGANVYRVASPVAGTITKVQSIIEGTLAVGDATLTGKIGAVAITDGAITITQAGSAAGDVDVVSPSAARTVAVGSDINFTVGGTNTTATKARITILIAT